jgi:hypothetical protein
MRCEHVRKVIILLILLVSFSTNSQILAATFVSQEPIRGIYVNAENTKGPQFEQLLNLFHQTDFNAMVIDIKDDHGNLTFIPSKNSPYFGVSHPYITNPRVLIQTLKKNNIYPIARIVVFKDNVLALSNVDYTPY